VRNEHDRLAIRRPQVSSSFSISAASGRIEREKGSSISKILGTMISICASATAFHAARKLVR
jgi:hypothetical protein